MKTMLLVLLCAFTLTACAMGPQATRTYHHGGLSQTEMDCMVFASQAAQGAGGWASVSPVQAAIYDHAKSQYYEQCLRSRGQ